MRIDWYVLVCCLLAGLDVWKIKLLKCFLVFLDVRFQVFSGKIRTIEYVAEHWSQFHRDRQALKMMHMASKASDKDWSKLNKFLQSEVNLLIQHIAILINIIISNEIVNQIKKLKFTFRLLSPSFLVKIVCYTWRPFTITLASSAIICAGRCLILTSAQ